MQVLNLPRWTTMRISVARALRASLSLLEIEGVKSARKRRKAKGVIDLNSPPIPAVTSCSALPSVISSSSCTIDTIRFKRPINQSRSRKKTGSFSTKRTKKWRLNETLRLAAEDGAKPIVFAARERQVAATSVMGRDCCATERNR